MDIKFGLCMIEDNGLNSKTKDSSSSNTDEAGSMKDYISGDSTPSSSSHQFPWIATNPKKDSKKSAMKTNH